MKVGFEVCGRSVPEFLFLISDSLCGRQVLDNLQAIMISICINEHEARVRLTIKQEASLMDTTCGQLLWGHPSLFVAGCRLFLMNADLEVDALVGELELNEVEILAVPEDAVQGLLRELRHSRLIHPHVLWGAGEGEAAFVHLDDIQLWGDGLCDWCKRGLELLDGAGRKHPTGAVVVIHTDAAPLRECGRRDLKDDLPILVAHPKHVERPVWMDTELLAFHLMCYQIYADIHVLR